MARNYFELSNCCKKINILFNLKPGSIHPVCVAITEDTKLWTEEQQSLRSYVN
jgi:hypothetical protein